jgi:hypothetical protein
MPSLTPILWEQAPKKAKPPMVAGAPMADVMGGAPSTRKAISVSPTPLTPTRNATTRRVARGRARRRAPGRIRNAMNGARAGVAVTNGHAVTCAVRIAPAGRLTLISLAGLVVVALSLLASFRLDFAADLATVLRANGARVLLGLAAGSAFGLGAALRLEAGTLRPLADLQWLAAASVAAGAGMLAAGRRPGLAGVAIFVGAGAVLGGLAWVVVGRLDRARRWSNVGALVALLVSVALAALAAGYIRARRDVTVPLTLWLLGDLGRVDLGPSLVLLGLTVIVALLAVRGREQTWSLVAWGMGLGATGPLPFVGTFVARTVWRLAPEAPLRSRVWVSAWACGAAVVAIDAVPRLLIGGYAFPFAVPAAMLALPVFLGWNRARLRTLAGSRGPLLEIGEVALIAGVTVYAAKLAYQLIQVVRQLT